jgi:hypothetical protein
MRPLRVLTLVVLAVVALAGLAAGAGLVLDPSGARFGLTVDRLPAWLRLDDYLVPGAAAAALFGVLPIVAAVLLVRRSHLGWSLASAVGLLMVLWSAGMLVVLGLPFPAVQAGFLMAGILLTGLGVDGGAVPDEYRDEYADDDGSYEHADDET